MHTSLLQPLLILAAIVVVGAVPMLGGTAPAMAMGASSAVSRGTGLTSALCQSTALARRSISTPTAVKRCDGRACTSAVSLYANAQQLSWAIRGGASVLPPPRT